MFKDNGRHYSGSVGSKLLYCIIQLYTVSIVVGENFQSYTSKSQSCFI